MKNLLLILLFTGVLSCQVLDSREIALNKTFCNDCKKPLKELLLKNEGIYVVKYNENILFYNYDAAKINVDSLDLILMKKGFLPRKDSIVIHPVCCNIKPKKRKIRKDSLN